MYYERSEPVAEAFGDLDPKIDARLADMKEEKKEDQWTGYHKIEKQLYQDNKIDSTTKKDADQLLKDAKEVIVQYKLKAFEETSLKAEIVNIERIIKEIASHVSEDKLHKNEVELMGHERTLKMQLDAIRKTHKPSL